MHDIIDMGMSEKRYLAIDDEIKKNEQNDSLEKDTLYEIKIIIYSSLNQYNGIYFRAKTLYMCDISCPFGINK